ncbi:sigma-70 family RNA polymerase sigma factor [Priestia aryabhattai]|uniref:sigma-70 family RNA polymerase sigma factor n=1 Tax=Priestia aryabhattai TaxID=412384 RepID=UPI002E1B806D|nr:sigma-70 family RNA polymerase sigma factor [Priestia aryabhattai]
MKEILLSNGEVKSMTFEEARKQFEPMVIKHMTDANNKFVYNAVEKEDFRQILDIEVWRAYEAYDIEQGNCFTTYLHFKLQKGVRNATYHRYAQKNQGTTISASAPIGDDELKLEDMFSTEDTSTDSIFFNELASIIKENVSEEEHEILQCLLNKKDFPVVDYAAKHNMTRQAANQRVKKLQKKLRQIVAQEYLEI